MLVLCTGMIRSGSTLQYNLARSLLTKLGAGKGEGFLDSAQLPLLTDQLHLWAKDEAIHVVKVHAIPALAAEHSTNATVRICYVYRDIRDVAASVKRIWGARGRKLFAALEKAIHTYYEVTAIPNVLLWKYENIVGDLTAPVEELAAFLGLEAPPDVVSTIAADCSLETAKLVVNNMGRKLLLQLRPILRRIGLPRSRVYHPGTLLHPNHISETEGRNDIWRELLDEEESVFISKRYASWLEEQGYAA